MKKKHYDKILVVILVMIMVFSSVATAFASSVNVTYNGSIFSYTASGGKPAENLHGTFSTSDGKPVYCAEHGIPSPMGDSIGNSLELNKQEYDNAQIRKILYYGYQGIEPWWGFSDPIYNRVYQIGFIGNVSQSKTQSCGVAVTSMALTRAYGGNGRVYEISGLSAFESFIASKPDPKANGFKAYLLPANNGYTQDLFTWEYYPKGYAKVKKTNASNSHLVAECPEHYNLAGAKYGIYESEANANGDIKRLATLTTDADGNSDVVTISAGTYYVKEVQAPKGYILDRTVYPVTVTSGQTSTVSTADEPRFDPLNIKVTKKPVEGSDKNLSIEGAEYTVKYYKQLTDGNGNKLTTAAQLKNLKPYRTWVIKTNKNGIAALGENYLVKEKSDPLFKNEYGDAVGLHGTYSIEETLAPAGFAKTDTVWVQQASFDSKLQHIESQLEDITDNEKPQTISITINKVDAETGKNEAQGYGSLAGAKYDVFFFDPVKSEDIKVATLTTDERGFARYEGGKPGLYKVVETKASNGYIIDKEYKEVRARLTEVNTANFDYVVTSKEKPINVEVEKTSIDENGVKVQVAGAELQLLDKDKNVIETFTSKKAAHKIKGLKPGKYYIHEVKAPEGYFPMEKDIEFEVKATEEVQNIEVFNEPTPEIKTAATFSDGTKNHKKGNDLVVIDKFSYKKVIAGEKYLVKGKLIDKATGKAVCETSKEFTPNKAKGSVDVNFKFDASKYDKGAEFVVTEQLYRIKNDKTEKLVAIHEDLTDLNQTVNIPSLKTTATDGADGNKNLITGKKQVIKDKVFYSNLYAGKEYKVSGVLMNKATGKPILVDGKEITAEKKFTAKEKSGYVELEFKLDTSSLKGETVVVFENLYEKGIEVGTHADINDIEQTTYVPELKTTATDKINDGKDLNGAEKQTIVDKVEYKSLYPGKAYTVKGILMDKVTGKAILDNGKEVTAETTLTPTKKDGTVTLEFNLNAAALKGKTIVVFEKLYEDGKELAIHTDINDVNQSMYIPKVKTKATFDDDSKNAKPSKDMSVVDVFTYENVIKGQKYIVKGELIDKATGKAISKGETKFTAKSTNGDVNVEFKFDGSKYKEGAELVVTEKLYSVFNGKEKLVASHVDIGDLNQTVNIPKIKTTATDKVDNGKDLNGNVKQTIVDRVEYKNLYAGKEYMVKGVLMNKATNKPILVDGKEITAEKKFTPEKTSGFVELEFTFDSSALKGETIVVFEKLYEDKIEVAVHTDINDKDQSVYIPEIKTTATSQDDGTKSVLPVNTVVVSDKVEYKNLIKGQMYEMSGTLVNTKTKEIVAKASGCFVCESEDGFVTLDFEFDATGLKGKDVVAFEELYKLDENGDRVKEVAEHADITDKGQTVKIENPEIKTTATFDDGAKKNTASKDMTIIDKVQYKNLVVGKEYTVKGILMNKATNKPFTVDGKEITGELTFTAEKSEGFVELEYKFDGTGLKKTELVVFENMYYKDQEIAAHNDITDEGQTVKIVPPGTVIFEFDGGNNNDNVKTGDEANLMLYTMLLLGSILVIAIIMSARKRANK